MCGRRQEKHGQIVLPQLTDRLDGRVSEELCASAAAMANNLNARAIFVYTRRGYMANFLSRCRPDCPIFAFTGPHASLPCCTLMLCRPPVGVWLVILLSRVFPCVLHATGWRFYLYHVPLSCTICQSWQ